MMVVFISNGVLGVKHQCQLVAVVSASDSVVVGGDGTSAEGHRTAHALVNGIKVGLRLFHRAEPVTAIVVTVLTEVAHVESSTVVVRNNLPLGSVQGLSVDDGLVHTLTS